MTASLLICQMGLMTGPGSRNWCYLSVFVHWKHLGAWCTVNTQQTLAVTILAVVTFPNSKPLLSIPFWQGTPTRLLLIPACRLHGPALPHGQPAVTLTAPLLVNLHRHFSKWFGSCPLSGWCWVDSRWKEPEIRRGVSFGASYLNTNSWKKYRAHQL